MYMSVHTTIHKNKTLEVKDKQIFTIFVSYNPAFYLNVLIH